MILFVQDLTVIDFSYLCPDRGVLGESWIVDVELEGGLDHQNMVLDFSHVKKQIKRLIDDTVDHSLTVPVKNDSIQIEEQAADRTKVSFDNGDKYLLMSCPNEAYTFLQAERVTKEAVTKFLIDELRNVLPSNVKKITLTLRDEVIDGAYYHYTHGLKKHDGNCQRIVHGHRSTIGIYENGNRSSELENQWAEKWRDIYLGSEEDIVSPSQLENLTLPENNDKASLWCFKYTSTQGVFELAISKSHCDIVDCDSTVECLAEYIANQLKQLNPNNNYKVRAYEGVGKGAIAYA